MFNPLSSQIGKTCLAHWFGFLPERGSG